MSTSRIAALTILETAGQNCKLTLTNITANAASSKETVTLNLTNRLSVRLYQDCRPNCLETAKLQKGLVLMLDNVELIEEGVGFGVPIARYEDKTFFSSSAHLSKNETGSNLELTKTYFLDTISRKKLPNGKYLDDGFYTLARKTFQKYYLNKKNLAPLFNKMMELREAAKIKTEFVKVKPRGAVTVKYQLQPKHVAVKVDFSDLTLSRCEEVLVLNEQGSNTFKKYADTNGLALFGAGIGAWDAISADEASMLSETAQVGFRIKKHREALLYRGWERTKNRFSWAGLSYSLKPNNRKFEYQIELL